MLRAFTVDDLLNVNQFTSRCPWDLSPDGRLLAVTLSQGKHRVPDDTRDYYESVFNWFNQYVKG